MALLNLSLDKRIEETRAQQMRGRVLLEEKIEEKTYGDAVLFPDLQVVHGYDRGPEWVKKLTFPEKLLSTEGPMRVNWKDYDVVKLTAKHPLFKTLSEMIALIASSQKDSQLKPILPSLLKIKQAYERYIQTCISLQGKQRHAHLKGPARLSGFIQGTPVCKEMNRKVARRLVSINRYNEEIRKNTFGASSVYFDREGNVFYKREYKNPLRPGKEYAFDAFNTLFLGGRATPSKLLKIGDVSVQDFPEQPYLFDWLEAKNVEPNLLYSDFVLRHHQPHPYNDERRHFLVQASLGIKGEELHTFLEGHPRGALAECIDQNNFAAMVFSALILRTNDGRADNYMLEQKPAGVKREVVGIDNDGILKPPLRITGDERHTVDIRSVLFLFPELMDSALDPRFVEYFKSLNLEKLFISYLDQLEKYNQALTPFMTSHILSERDMHELALPIKLSFSNLLSLYQSTKLIQDSLSQNPQQSAADIFRQLYPIIYETYRALLAAGETPLEVQNRLFDPQTVPIIEEVLGRSKEEVHEAAKNLPGMQKDGELLSILEILALFLDYVIPLLEPKKQQQLLMHTHKMFPNFKKTSFKGIKFSDVTLAEVVQKADLKELLIEESEEITPEGVVVLLSDNPHLKVTLGKNPRFTPPALAELIKRAQKMKRPLFYRIKDKDYPLSKKEELQSVLKPAIESGHFVLAEALVKNFSIKFSLTDPHKNTWLHDMARRGAADAVRFLVETCGLSSEILNDKGQSSFHIAAEQGSIKVLETLIHLEGESPKGLAQRDQEGRTPFNIATRAMNEAASFLLNEILNHRLPHEKIHLEKDPEGYTLLHIAAKFGLGDEVIRLIEQHNFDVNVRGDCERTPLHMASFNGKVTAARALLERGANVNAQASDKDHKTTPLLDAVMHEDLPMIQLLAEQERLDVNITNDRNLSAIDFAIIVGKLPILRLLMSHPSCQNVEASLDGWIDAAKKNRHFHLLPFLFAEKSLIILRTMDPETKASETQKIITRLTEGLRPV